MCIATEYRAYAITAAQIKAMEDQARNARQSAPWRCGHCGGAASGGRCDGCGAPRVDLEEAQSDE